MKRLFIYLPLLLSSPSGIADIYKYIDANGIVTYTNVKPAPGNNSELVIQGPKLIHPDAPATEKKATSKQPGPANFPKVDPQTQSLRDQKRKTILSNELDQEKQSLESLKAQYEEAKNTPEVYRNAQGKTFRNVAKYEEKLRLYEAEIQAHERNIELLNKELNH